MTGNPLERAYTAMQEIRNHLSNNGFHQHSMVNFDHSIACAAADAFDDAALAIAAFRPKREDEATGDNYLRVYGVLSAAYLQQNAAMQLHSASGLGKLDLPEGSRRLRKIRDHAIAHPAPDPSKGERATFIARYSIGSATLTLHTYTRGDDSAVEDVQIFDCLSCHNFEMANVMEAIAHHLSILEEQVREKLKAEGSFSILLHPTWPYLLSKIYEGSDPNNPSRVMFAKSHVGILHDMSVEIENELLRRNVHAIDPWHFRVARGQLDRLEHLLSRAFDGDDVEVDIITFADGLEKQFKHIANVLSEIDAQLEVQS